MKTSCSNEEVRQQLERTSASSDLDVCSSIKSAKKELNQVPDQIHSVKAKPENTRKKSSASPQKGSYNSYKACKARKKQELPIETGSDEKQCHVPGPLLESRGQKDSRRQKFKNMEEEERIRKTVKQATVLQEEKIRSLENDNDGLVKKCTTLEHENKELKKGLERERNAHHETAMKLKSSEEKTEREKEILQKNIKELEIGIKQIHDKLTVSKKKLSDKTQAGLKMQNELRNLEMGKEFQAQSMVTLREKHQQNQAEIVELRAENERKDDELVESGAEIQRKDHQLVQSRADIQRQDYQLVQSRADIQRKDHQLVQSRIDIQRKDHQLVQSRERNLLMHNQLVESDVEMQWMHNQLVELRNNSHMPNDVLQQLIGRVEGMLRHFQNQEHLQQRNVAVRRPVARPAASSEPEVL